MPPLQENRLRAGPPADRPIAWHTPPDDRGAAGVAVLRVPDAIRGAPHRVVGSAVAVEVARDRNVAVRAPPDDRRRQRHRAANPPLTAARPENRDVVEAVTVPITRDRYVAR